MTATAVETRYDAAREAARSVLESEPGQYTLRQIGAIWLAAGAPMWILGWLAYPLLSRDLAPVEAGLLRIKLFTVGLIWQFMLAMLILYREEGNIRLATIRRRFWLNNPVSPKTGQKDNRLWWLLVPLILLNAAQELGIAPFLNDLWTRLLPFLAEPESYSPAVLFAPELRALWVGAWDLLALQAVL